MSKRDIFSEDDHRFMARAFELANHADKMNEVPVGAVVVQQGNIIAEAFNQPIASHDPTAHAEIIALRRAGSALQNYRCVDTTVYITLEPCAMCAMALIHARVSRVVYAAKDLKTGADGSVFDLLQSPLHNHNIIVNSGLMAEDCSQQLSRFFQRRRKEKKLEKQ